MSCYVRTSRKSLTPVFRHFDSTIPIMVHEKHVYGFFPNLLRGAFKIHISPIYYDRKNPLKLSRARIKDTYTCRGWVVTGDYLPNSDKEAGYAVIDPTGMRPVLADVLLDRTQEVRTIVKISGDLDVTFK